MLLKIMRPRPIFIRLPAVLATIDLDDQLDTPCYEIANEGADGRLAVEANARDLSRA